MEMRTQQTHFREEEMMDTETTENTTKGMEIRKPVVLCWLVDASALSRRELEALLRLRQARERRQRGAERNLRSLHPGVTGIKGTRILRRVIKDLSTLGYEPGIVMQPPRRRTSILRRRTSLRAEAG
jgi:hypothetical protein